MVSITANDLKCIITSEETAIYTYGPEIELKSSEYRAVGESK